MIGDNEKEARTIAAEISNEIQFARSRPARNLQEVDTHLDILMARVERLARVVGYIAAKSD